MKVRRIVLFAGILAAAMIVSILASPARADCVLDWSFNGNLTDPINGYNGTMYGGTANYGAAGSGPLGVGQCINLTTAEDVYNSTSTFSNLPTAATSAWSMNVWLNLNPASLGTYYTWLAGFASYGTSGYGETRVLGSEGNDMFYWGYGADYPANDLPSGIPYYTDSAWHMYTVTYSGGASGTMDLYRDSTLEASWAETLSNATPYVQVGAAGAIWGSVWSGSAADFTVWNNCLAASQVSYLNTNPSATGFAPAAPNIGLQWTGATNGDWSTNPASLNWSATAGGGPSLSYSDNQSVFLDDSGSANTTISVSAANVAPASVTFSNSAYNYTLTGAYGITGAAALTLNGSGMVTLSNNNAYTGATTINSGTLVIGAAAGASPNSAFTINVNNGLVFGTGVTSGTLGGLAGSGNLALTSSDSLNVALTVGNSQNTSYSGALSGGGSLATMGTGVLFLSGSNTYTGPTAVNGGTLQIGGAGVLGGGSYAGNIAIASGAALLMNTSSNQTLSGAISGLGALTQAGPGTLALTGNNNYAGATTISAGTLQLGGAGVLGGGNYANSISIASSAAMIVNTSSNQTFAGGIIDNGAIVVNSSGNQTFSYIYSGTGSFTQAGPGTVFVNGPYNLATGSTTTVSGGMLVANAILGQSSVLVTSGGTLVANQDAYGTYVPLLTIQGGLVTTGSNGSYNVTPPNIVFNGGGTIASAGERRVQRLRQLQSVRGPCQRDQPRRDDRHHQRRHV